MESKNILQKIKQVRLDLRREIIEITDGKVEVVINGELRVLAIVMPGNVKSETIASLKTALNKAITKAQKQALKSMKELTK